MNTREDKKVLLTSGILGYTDYKGGLSEGKVFLFLHGWGEDRCVWDSVIEELRPLARRLVAVDLPGFGTSENPVTVFGADEYARVLKEFFQKERVDNAVVFGHSFGCRVAVRLSLEHGLVSSLVLSNSAGIKINSIRTSILAIIAKLLKPLPVSIKERLYLRIGSDYTLYPELKETFKKIVKEDDRKVFKRVSVPTLIIWGRDDEITPLSSGEKIHEYIKESDLKTIEGVGHNSFLEDKEPWVSVVKNFLKTSL